MKTILFTIAFSLAGFLAAAQLKGSGKTITRSYDFKNFDKVSFDDLDGKLEIEVGKPYGISITIDDNLENLLTIAVNTNTERLTIALKGNQNNNMYIEDTNIKVKITLPFVAEVSNNGNSGLVVTNINSKNFKSINPVNGSTTLSGIVDNLEVICRGNGNLNANKLMAKNASITCRGNGNARVNVSDTIQATSFGNGNVLNIGQAKI